MERGSDFPNNLVDSYTQAHPPVQDFRNPAGMQAGYVYHPAPQPTPPSQSPYAPVSPYMTVRPNGPAAFIAYGSFMRRFAALAIDGILIGVVFAGIFAIVMIVTALFTATFRGGLVGALPGIFFLFSIPVFLLLPIFYHVVLETGPSQATLGKQWMGLRVVTVDGRTLSLWQSVGRLLVRTLFSGALFGAGYFLALFTDRKQTLHDLLLSTMVVRR